jgi:hypothetical protein
LLNTIFADQGEETEADKKSGGGGGKKAKGGSMQTISSAHRVYCIHLIFYFYLLILL